MILAQAPPGGNAPTPPYVLRTRRVVPDVIIERVGDDYVVQLNPGNARFRVDWVARTLRRVAQSLVHFQRGFLDQGLPFLRPLTLGEVGADIEMHGSSVCRAIMNRYVQTPRGVFALKSFFHGGLETATGAAVSSVWVKQMIQDMVEREQRAAAVSDRDIARALHEHGVTISRRTVANYRRELGFPSSYQRRQLVRATRRARSAPHGTRSPGASDQGRCDRRTERLPLTAAMAARRALYDALVTRFGVVIVGRHLARIDAILDRVEADAGTQCTWVSIRVGRSPRPRSS
jgi:hypothetical protein